jgi:heme/copper-type cytochrome/quinol oxidase subunit 2
MRRKLLQAMTAGLVLATATGCTSKDFPRLGFPTPTTEEGPRILSLWQGSWAAALAVGVLVWALIMWSVVFHRRSRTKVEIPPQTRYNMPIEALYTVVPLIIVSVLFYFTARDETKLLSLDKKPDVTVNVVGFQWSWGYHRPQADRHQVAVPGHVVRVLLIGGVMALLMRAELAGRACSSCRTSSTTSCSRCTARSCCCCSRRRCSASRTDHAAADRRARRRVPAAEHVRLLAVPVRRH